jgi:diguanylate cyclase (GGDEF)-like protein/PAS domain S-box-containing protein
MLYLMNIYLFMAVILTAFLTAFGVSKSRAGYTKIFSALCFFVSIYVLGYLQELNSLTLEQMAFWNQVQYFGLPFFPPLWCLVALSYTKGIAVHKRVLFLYFLIPFITFILRLTNATHHLFYQSMSLKETVWGIVLYLEKGPWYYVHNAYTLFALITVSWIFLGQLRRSTHSNRRRYGILLVASVIPYIGTILIMLDFMELGIDYGAFFVPISLGLILYAILKYNFLEIKKLARETIFENSPDGMVLFNKEYRILDYNKSARQFFSFHNVTLLDSQISEVFADREDMLDVFMSERSQELHFYMGHEEKFYEIISDEVLDSSGRKLGILKTIRDITETKKIQKKLRLLAIVDELSGLYNRRHFMELAEKKFEDASNSQDCFSVLMLDLDHFKLINDTLGHAAGDAAIREVGSLMMSNFRKQDLCGRLGGEEFGVLLTNTGSKEAKLISEKFRNILENSNISYEGKAIKLSVSIGVASYFGQAESFDEILKHADAALYTSKAMGRNRITVFENI